MIFKKNGNIVDNLGDIRLFVEAANLGGLSAAGRKLGLSPAAASARLVKLEATLHTRLFERTTRQLRLTEEGRMYLLHCQQALPSLDDAPAALQAWWRVVRWTIRVSAAAEPRPSTWPAQNAERRATVRSHASGRWQVTASR